MRSFAPVLVLSALASPVLASPALAQDEMMPWQGDASFSALSKTAFSTTGDITLSGPPEAKILTTASGTEIVLRFVEDRSAGWNLSDPELWPGGVFAVDEDPGPLENGNTLCGEDPATYLVFTPLDDKIAGSFLQIAAFNGAAPENIDSNGLCGTFNYAFG